MSIAKGFSRKWLTRLVVELRKAEGLPPRRGTGYKGDWVRMLTGWGPMYFWTATHENQRTVAQWVRIMQRMKLRLMLDGQVWEFFYVCEENKRGGYHVHALVRVKGGLFHDGYHSLRKVGDMISGGMNRTELVKGEVQIRYLVKYMFKGGRLTIGDRYGFI